MGLTLGFESHALADARAGPEPSRRRSKSAAGRPNRSGGEVIHVVIRRELLLQHTTEEGAGGRRAVSGRSKVAHSEARPMYGPCGRPRGLPEKVPGSHDAPNGRMQIDHSQSN